MKPVLLIALTALMATPYTKADPVQPVVADAVKDRYVPLPFDAQSVNGLLGDRMRTNTWAYTHNPKLKAKLDETVKTLLAAQMPDGYLGTYMLEHRWTEWDVWAHKYNLIALLNYYRTTGNPAALQACRRMGDLLVKTFGDGPGQRNIAVGTPHRGMASTSVLEGMDMLYRYLR